MTGPKLREKCKNGHLMAETRKRKKCNDETYCSVCRFEYDKKRRKENPQRIKEQKRAWNIKTLYGLTTHEYNQIYVDQNGKCAICKIDLTTLDRTASVDHNHNTGQVRGLLCNNCNRAIGLLKDDVGVLESAITYLLRTPCYH